MEDNMNLNANTTDVVENMDDEIIADDISEKLNDNIGADSVDTELTDTLEEDTLTDSNDVKFGEPLAENLSKEEETEETTLMPEEQIVTPIEPPKRETLPNEIGLVSNINGNEINIKVTSSLFMEKNLIDSYVVFGTDASRMVGIVTSVNSELATVRLIGELNNEKFIPGIELKPMINSVCFLTTTEEMKQILASDQNNKVIKKTLLGTMPLYNNTPVYVSTNDFFSNHFAIFGNTGSGKSCGVARLLQNVFFNDNQAPRNACMFIFDAYGEYESALSVQNSQIFFKRYSTNVKDQKSNLIKIPLWFLDIDDIALLLDVDDVSQLPIIEKALRLVTAFSGNDVETRTYKNDIIAKAILELLYSGGSASQIHDQIFAILTSFSTPDLNLETPIVQPGYTRSLRQCLIIDKEGKINEIGLVSEFIKKYINPDLKLELPDGSVPYTLENLQDALEFALISEGILKSDKIYDKANALKVRLDSLIKGEYAEYFKVDSYIDKNTFIKNLITASNGARAQIININISYLDDRFAKTICKIYAKLLFDFTSKLQVRGSFPVHIILEEAHRYVQNDSDIKILGYNIFERIAKEGRKYGTILGLISQRPSELSETVLSQCTNFLIFKMQHPRDVQFIKQMVPNITDEIVEKLKGLQPGTCVAFGLAFKIAVIVKIEMPYPQPMSQNVDVSRLWYY